MNVIKLLNEPTAAAIAYLHNNINKDDFIDGGYLLVFDFGGGTLDISIAFFNKTNGHFKVLATSGDA